jgi:hypothetical protein
MKLDELNTGLFKSKLWSAETHVRTPGLHLTDILYPMMEERGETPDRPDLTEEDLEGYRAVGFLWERVLVRALTDMAVETDEHVIRLGEFTKDGVIFTPDAMLIRLPEALLEEWKCTWTSCNRWIEDRKQWWIQIMAYCHALDLNAATVRVLYINGTWRPPIPRTRHYRATFNKRELQENWDMLLNYARSKGMMK